MSDTPRLYVYAPLNQEDEIWSWVIGKRHVLDNSCSFSGKRRVDDWRRNRAFLDVQHFSRPNHIETDFQPIRLLCDFVLVSLVLLLLL